MRIDVEKLGRQELNSLVSLAEAPESRVYLEMLVAWYEGAKEELVERPNERSAGYAQALKDVWCYDYGRWPRGREAQGAGAARRPDKQTGDLDMSDGTTGPNTNQTSDATMQAVVAELQAIRQATERAAQPPADNQPAAGGDDSILAYFAEQARAAEQQQAEAARDAALANRTPWHELATAQAGEDAVLDPVAVTRLADTQIREDFSAENERLRRELAAANEQAKQAAEMAKQAALQAKQTSHDRFVQDLSTAVPDYFPQVNNDPKFRSGLPRWTPWRACRTRRC